MNFSSVPTNTTVNEIKISGIISDDQLKPMMERLTGLLGTKEKPFKEWTNVYKTLSSLPPPQSSTIQSEDATVVSSLSLSKEFEIHVVADVVKTNVLEKMEVKETEKIVWKDIKSLGVYVLPQKDMPFKSNVRTVSLSGVYGGSPLTMLEMLACEFVYEYVKEGYRFISKTGTYVDIYTLKKVMRRGFPLKENCVPVNDTASYGVEAYKFAPQHLETTYAMEKELTTLASNLANLEIYLGKVD
ncbi:hypothetical protein C9374_002573 [Naegleria lovaniensis]|uniref:Mediator of RNA polymerase II transcription subunit 18 n=1 Tax=Naegleria lovaniensis TaxID=51637 RepID=A0AA88KQ73_NAELO|nr:uncharacterized protein C9374_002573 [Naegleria lovaniensis]KAG2386127.1 hypothetical protein C9374_002573 [Naegleria lovaniensis]